MIDLLSGARTPWWGPVVRAGLWLLQWPYRFVISRRNAGYDAGRGVTRVDVPVVSIGNLTTGGTGKTPVVAWLCRRLRQHGVRVATLSRGYGAEPGQRNDEALELERRLPDVPHLQDPDRIAAARIAIDELAARCLVLDDAFQHRRLGRDLDWVLIDATCPFGFGHLLPRGLLREPVTSLHRADAVLITRVDQVDEAALARIRTRIEACVGNEVPIVQTCHRPQGWVDSSGRMREIDALKDRKALAVCGIGNPESFLRSLESVGVRVVDRVVFQDHHRYDRSDVEHLRERLDAHPEVEFVVCTVKDLVKLDLPMLGERPLLAMQIELELLGSARPLDDQLLPLIDRALDEGDR